MLLTERPPQTATIISAIRNLDAAIVLSHRIFRGNTLGNFQMPTGVFIDKSDRVYVVDSFNRRVQIFHYYGLKKQAQGPADKGVSQ